MAYYQDIDLNPLNQLDFEMLRFMGAFMQQNARFHLQPHQPQPEDYLTYDATFPSNELALRTICPQDLRRNPVSPGEQQFRSPEPRNPVPFMCVQNFPFDEAPTGSSSATIGLANAARPSMADASSQSSHSGTKRKLADHVGCFPISDNPDQNRRKRRTFDPDRRKKVALLRKVGACSRCKARRVECNFPGPCESCIDAVESINLAKHICIRQTLLDLRFGDTSYDFLSQSYTEQLLQIEIGAFHGEKRIIACNLLFRGVDTITPKPLLLEVQDYSVPDANAPPLMFDCLVGYDSTNPIFKRVVSDRYALAPDSLPTVKQLLDWIQLDVHSPNESTVKRFMLSLGEFMERYCAEQPDVPMYEMLNSAVTILKLLRCWRNCKMTTSSDSANNKRHISRTVVSQLLLIIKDGIRAAEVTLLDALQKLAYSTKGPGKSNMIPLWTTLWTLILTYRDCMTTYKYATLHCKISFEHDAADSDELINASKHMYHILTSVYAALFRASTPLYLDWREGANMELLGNSEELRRAFIALRTEVEWFYGQKHRLGSEDARLKNEIIEQEQRLKPKYPTNVVVKRVKPKPLRAEDNIGVGCPAGSGCHSPF